MQRPCRVQAPKKLSHGLHAERPLLCKLDDPDAKKDLEWAHADLVATQILVSHRSISGKNTMRNLLVFLWIFGLIPAPIYCFLDMEKIRVFYDQFVWVAFDVIFVVLFIVTYGSLFYRKKRSNLQFRHKDTNDDNHRFFIVTTVILIGFVFFATIPDLVLTIPHADNMIILLSPVFELWWNINMLIDPFIYVFLQPRFRKVALSKIPGWCMFNKRCSLSLVGTGTGYGTRKHKQLGKYSRRTTWGQLHCC